MDTSDRQKGSPKHKKHKQHRGAFRPPAPRPAAPAAPVDLPLPEGGIHINGSMLEGGGQILRNASALSAILQRPLKVGKIRAGRDKPGLRPQHLTGLQLISELCSAQLQGGEVGSSCITLTPGRLVCGTHIADTRTAGSCMLLAQSALPCLLFASRPAGTAGEAAAAAPVEAAAAAAAGAGAAAAVLPEDAAAAPAAAVVASVDAAAADTAAAGAGAPTTKAAPAPLTAGAAAAEAGAGAAAEAGAAAAGGDTAAACSPAAALQASLQLGTASFLDLKGGTDAAMAPPAGHMQHVLLPLLRSLLGIQVSMQLERRGFFPKGQGHVALTVQALPPGACLPAINLTERGEITGVTVRAFTAGRLVPTIGERMAAAAQKEIKARMPRCNVSRQTPLSTEVVHEPAEVAFGDGCGILVTAHSSTGCIFGASGLGERGVPAEAIGERAATELMDALGSGACTDEWLQDQLVIFMALAQGRSRVLTGEPTLHTRTACMVAEALTGAKFRITPQRQQTDGSRAPGGSGGSGDGLWLIECEGAAVPTPGP